MAARATNPFTVLARSWFGLALLVWLLLALPGVILFALRVFNRDQALNTWLKEHFRLTYGLAVPSWVGLLLLLLPLAIILLYFLKLKRKPLQVPSTFLWRKSIEDLHVNSLFQWLRENVLLLLQLLVVLFLIYASLDFRYESNPKESKHFIVMIDNSASMSATDVEPSRLEWAKQEALKIIDAADDGDLGMVIVFNSSAEIVQSYTDEHDLLRRAIRDIEQSQRPTRIDEALSLADSLANPTRSIDEPGAQPEGAEPGKKSTGEEQGISAVVHLFSDGRFPDVPESKFSLGNLNLHYHVAGEPGAENVDNVGLITLSAKRDDDDPGHVSVLAVIQNYRSKEASVRVELTVQVAGKPDDVYEKPALSAPPEAEGSEPGKDKPGKDKPGKNKDGSIGPRETGKATFELTGLDDQTQAVLHAKLLDNHDQFPLDDEAWLVIGPVRKARVLLVGTGNKFLDAFFNEKVNGKFATFTRLTPAELDDPDKYRKPACENAAYDLVIFDRCGPKREEDMPSANTFFIGYPPPPWKPSTADVEKYEIRVEKVEYPHIKGWINNHPLLRYVTALYEIGISDAFKMPKLPRHTPRLMESDREMAVLLTLNRLSFTDLVLTFPIITDEGEMNTNWPRHGSFLIFLRNVLHTLGHVHEAVGEETVQPGQGVVLRPDVAVEEVKVIGPEHKTYVLKSPPSRTGAKRPQRRADFAFSQTDRVGVYQVEWEGAVQRSFAVNLLDPEESNLEPRTTLQIGDEQIDTGQIRTQLRDLWKPLVLLAVGFLLLEWYIYNRRIYI
jgi:hypothetical protein